MLRIIITILMAAFVLLPELLCAAIPRGIHPTDRFTPSDRSIAVRVLLAKGMRRAVVRSDDSVLLIAGKRLKAPITVRLFKHQGKPTFQYGSEKVHSNRIEMSGSHPKSILEFNGRRYHGTLVLHATGSAFTVVNKVPLNHYLAGTLGNEMSPSWEMEALKAQAVVSRSYTLHRLRHPSHPRYDMKSSVADQVYRGAGSETERTRTAVKLTDGIYLAYANRPMKTYFHARCGGMTAKPESVWQTKEPGQDKNIPCPYCRRYPYQWTMKVTAAELKRVFSVPGTTLPRFFSVRGPSGRISDLEARSKAHVMRLRSDTLRARLGYSRLKSTRFQWLRDKQDIVFNGVGLGHGVGMCQWGARYLAQSGMKFRDILSHYYPQSQMDVI